MANEEYIIGALGRIGDSIEEGNRIMHTISVNIQAGADALERIATWLEVIANKGSGPVGSYTIEGEWNGTVGDMKEKKIEILTKALKENGNE